MNFQAYLADAYRITRDEPFVLVLGGLLVQLLAFFSFGLLAGPFLGGYTLLIILYLREDKKPSFNDIFAGLQQFGNLFPYFLVLLFIFLGFALLIIPGLLFATWWLYVLPLMVDRKMGFLDAMKLSMNKVNEKGFLMHFVFTLLIYLIPIMLLEFLSAAIPFAQILKIFLPPLQVGCLASLYLDMFEPDVSLDDKDENHETANTSADISLPENESGRISNENQNSIGEADKSATSTDKDVIDSEEEKNGPESI